MTDSLQQIYSTQNQRVDYKGFAVYFDPEVHLPQCVIYELTAEETDGNVPRAKGFTQDEDVEGCPAPNAYHGSGKERGHMAPAADFKWDSVAMSQTFLMTNICPQDKSLNEGGWNRLEEKVREWALRDGALIIAAGPVLENGLERTEQGVAIPKRFYKVVLAHQAHPVRAIAFIYPNGASNGRLRQYAVSVDSVERVTGLDFFSALPDEIEARVEACDELNLFLMR